MDLVPTKPKQASILSRFGLQYRILHDAVMTSVLLLWYNIRSKHAPQEENTTIGTVPIDFVLVPNLSHDGVLVPRF